MSVRRGALRSAACGSRESRCSEVLVRKSGCCGSRAGPTSISNTSLEAGARPGVQGNDPTAPPSSAMINMRNLEPQKKLMCAGERLHITNYRAASVIFRESDSAPHAVSLRGHACYPACSLSIQSRSCFPGLWVVSKYAVYMCQADALSVHPWRKSQQLEVSYENGRVCNIPAWSHSTAEDIISSYFATGFLQSALLLIDEFSTGLELICADKPYLPRYRAVKVYAAAWPKQASR